MNLRSISLALTLLGLALCAHAQPQTTTTYYDANGQPVATETDAFVKHEFLGQNGNGYLLVSYFTQNGTYELWGTIRDSLWDGPINYKKADKLVQLAGRFVTGRLDPLVMLESYSVTLRYQWQGQEGGAALFTEKTTFTTPLPLPINAQGDMVNLDTSRATGEVDMARMDPYKDESLYYMSNDRLKAQIDSGTLFLAASPQPEPTQGIDAFYQYIGEGIAYPPIAKRRGAEGMVFVSFVVTKEGEIDHSTIRVPKGLEYGCHRAALELLHNCPLEWQAGQHNGQPVNTNMIMPITFKLN